MPRVADKRRWPLLEVSRFGIPARLSQGPFRILHNLDLLHDGLVVHPSRLLVYFFYC